MPVLIPAKDDGVQLCFFVVYDGKLRDLVLELLSSGDKNVTKTYEIVKIWLDKIVFEFADRESTLPAKFASVVFLGGDVWDFALEVRVVPAIFQLLINAMKLPLWVNWADMEIGGEIIRLIMVFSNASKVEGIPGQVIVAQFSDDDREVEVEFRDKKLKITTLLGGIALLFAVARYLGKSINLIDMLKDFNETMKAKLKEAIMLKG